MAVVLVFFLVTLQAMRENAGQMGGQLKLLG
jgi:hypothetical protein